MKSLVVFVLTGLLACSCSPTEKVKNSGHYEDYKISISIRNNEEVISAVHSICLRYSNFIERRKLADEDDLVKLEFVVNAVGDAGLKQIREDLALVPHVISISIHKLI